MEMDRVQTDGARGNKAGKGDKKWGGASKQAEDKARHGWLDRNM